MSFEIAFIILIFAICSYAIALREKLYTLSAFVALIPLIYFFTKDYGLYPYLFAGTFCAFTHDKRQMPFMLAMLAMLGVADLNIELELLAIYASLLILRNPKRDEVGRSLAFIMPLSVVSIMVVGQFSNLQVANLIQIMMPALFMIVWHHLFILAPSFEWRSALEGKTLFKLFLTAYVLPLKLAPTIGGVIPYINPKLVAFSAYATMTVTLVYSLWAFASSDRGKITALLFSLCRLLLVVAICTGLELELKENLLVILFLELIGRLLLVALSASSKGYLITSPGIALGLRLATLSFIYQFLFLPGSMSSYLTVFLGEGSFQQSDFIWRIFSYLQMILIMLGVLLLAPHLSLRKKMQILG